MIKTAIDLFEVKRITMKFEYKDNPIITQLPMGVGYLDEKTGTIYHFGTLTIRYVTLDLKDVKVDVFTACIDDDYFIDNKGKLTNDHTLAAQFNIQSNNGDKTYDTLNERVASVLAAVLDGKIRYKAGCEPDKPTDANNDEINKLDVSYAQCQVCEDVFLLSEIGDAEDDGVEVYGTCPTCKDKKSFVPCDEYGEILIEN